MSQQKNKDMVTWLYNLPDHVLVIQKRSHCYQGILFFCIRSQELLKQKLRKLEKTLHSQLSRKGSYSQNVHENKSKKKGSY